MLSHVFTGLGLIALTSAHFQLQYPKARGFTEDTEPNFPCGGFDTVSSNRTNFTMGGGPIQMNFEHPQTNVAVYLAMGDNPGSAFNTVMLQQVTISGLGSVCLGSVGVPSGMNISDGTPATIQVMTNDVETGKGGLYQCADVLLVNAALSSSDYNNDCKNNTGVKVTQYNVPGNPNTTATTKESKGAEAHSYATSWVLGAAALVSMIML